MKYVIGLPCLVRSFTLFKAYAVPHGVIFLYLIDIKLYIGVIGRKVAGEASVANYNTSRAFSVTSNKNKEL